MLGSRFCAGYVLHELCMNSTAAGAGIVVQQGSLLFHRSTLDFTSAGRLYTAVMHAHASSYDWCLSAYGVSQYRCVKQGYLVVCVKGAVAMTVQV